METALAQDNQNQESLGTFGELWGYFSPYSLVGFWKHWLVTGDNLFLQVSHKHSLGLPWEYWNSRQTQNSNSSAICLMTVNVHHGVKSTKGSL